MASFASAFLFMSKHEWDAAHNFTNNPSDPGGATKWGITQRTLSEYRQNHPDRNLHPDVEELELAQAMEIYHDNYWIWEGIANNDVASKCFDIGVNIGVGQAVCYLQTALRGMGKPVSVDGHFGPITLGATNAVDPDELLHHLCNIQAIHYSNWIAASPKREQFRAGLMARALDLPTKEA